MKLNALESNDVNDAVEAKHEKSRIRELLASHIVPDIVERSDFSNDLVSRDLQVQCLCFELKIQVKNSNKITCPL